MCGDRHGDVMRARRLSALVCAGCMVVATAHAAHPLLSEDTGTQGAGHTELELGTSWIRQDGGRVFELDPQLSYGLREEMDAILRPSLFHLTGGAADAA